jgi:hypothetical protein
VYVGQRPVSRPIAWIRSGRPNIMGPPSAATESNKRRGKRPKPRAPTWRALSQLKPSFLIVAFAPRIPNQCTCLAKLVWANIASAVRLPMPSFP